MILIVSLYRRLIYVDSGLDAQGGQSELRDFFLKQREQDRALEPGPRALGMAKDAGGDRCAGIEGMAGMAIHTRRSTCEGAAGVARMATAGHCNLLVWPVLWPVSFYLPCSLASHRMWCHTCNLRHFIILYSK